MNQSSILQGTFLIGAPSSKMNRCHESQAPKVEGTKIVTLSVEITLQYVVSKESCPKTPKPHFILLPGSNLLNSLIPTTNFHTLQHKIGKINITHLFLTVNKLDGKLSPLKLYLQAEQESSIPHPSKNSKAPHVPKPISNIWHFRFNFYKSIFIKIPFKNHYQVHQ